MKVNISRFTKNDFFAIAVWHMMRSKTSTEDMCKVFNIVPDDNGEVDLKLTVNGVELNCKDFMFELERQHNDMIERDAKEQIRAQVSVMLDRMTEIIKEAENATIEEIETTFPGRKIW